MAKITVVAYRQVITKDNFHKSPEDLENLGLQEFAFTKTLVDMDDIQEVSERTSKESVLHFYDGRLYIVKESYEELCFRMDKAEEQYYAKYAAMFPAAGEEEAES